MMTVLKDSRKRALAADAITAPVTVVAFLSSMLELGLFDFDIFSIRYRHIQFQDLCLSQCPAF